MSELMVVSKESASAADASADGHLPSFCSTVWSWCFPSIESFEELCSGLSSHSLYVFGLNNPFRRRCIFLVKGKPFERMSLLLILANCLFLAMDSNDPDFPTTRLGRSMRATESIFLLLFTVEMALKLIALGVFSNGGSYFRDGWNAIDFIVVILGWISWLPGVENISAMRAVRVLRPLRTLNGVKGMRLLVETLFASLPMLLDVLILCGFLFTILGIIGVQMFAGALRRTCGVPEGDSIVDGVLTNVTSFERMDRDEDDWPSCGDGIIQLPPSGGWFASNGSMFPAPRLGHGHTCSDEGSEGFGVHCFVGNWENNPNHGFSSFDNIFWALLAIFQCVTLEGWVHLMYALQDAVHVHVWIYFILLIVLGSFFAVNLALAVLYLHFEQAQAGRDSVHEELTQQRQKLITVSPQEPVAQSDDTWIARWWHTHHTMCYYVQAHPYFEYLNTGLIIFNTAVMAASHAEMTPQHIRAEQAINYALTAYFALELVIKAAGLGLGKYLEDRLNAFDAVVVVASLLEVPLELLGWQRAGLSAFRAFRLMRLFKLARQWKELNKIIQTIFKSLDSIAYMSLLLLLFSFVMALLGKQLFGYRFQDCAVEAARPWCPPGMNRNDACPGGAASCYRCPAHRDCYVPCSEAEWGTWIEAEGSPFNGLAFCERFPQSDLPTTDKQGLFEYGAKAGKSVVARHNFDSFFWSVVTIFHLLTGEDWQVVMFDGMRTVTPFACLYFLFVFIIGNYIILNLFLAILLDQFASGHDDVEELLGYSPEAAVDRLQASFDKLKGQTNDEPNGQPTVQKSLDLAQRNASFLLAFHGKVEEAIGYILLKKHRVHGRTGDEHTAPNDVADSSENQQSVTIGSQSTETPFSEAKGALQGHALGLLGPNNGLRTLLAKVVCHPYFERTIILLIFVSSVTLALDGPQLDPQSRLKEWLGILDLMLVIIFAIEAAIKILVYGFIRQPTAYLRSPWNILDFATVAIGIIFAKVSGSSSQLTSLRSLRTLRALRPIRMASRAPGMKVVVNTLFQVVPASGNVMLVCGLFYLIFGILAVGLFKGTFSACQDIGGNRIEPEYVLPKEHWPLTSAWCDIGEHEVNAGLTSYHSSIPRSALPANNSLSSGNIYKLQHVWVKEDANFDNIFAALLTLFEIATLEMWQDYMYNAVDATSPGKQPVQDSNPAASLYFIVFIIVGSFFVLNLFVGVAIDKFNDMQAEHLGLNVFLTPEQEQWVAIQKMIAKCKPSVVHKRPRHWLRGPVFDVVMSESFEKFVIAAILCNVAFLSMVYADMPQSVKTFLVWANIAFTFTYAVESICKIVALGFRPYLKDRWCLFDLIVVVASIVHLGVELSTDTDVPAVSFMRVFRVARIFRLLPKAKGLRTLFQTLVFSLPALINVGSVFCLFMFIFAIMGMSLFGQIRLQGFLTRNVNFKDFPTSLLTLMRMVTGEEWNGIMHACFLRTECKQVLQPFNNAAGTYVEVTTQSGIWYDAADEHLKGAPSDAIGDHCGPWASITIAYYILFVVIVALVLLNLVIAVILDNFQNSANNEELEVNQGNVLDFTNAWSKMDQKCTMYLPTAKLSQLIEVLDPPLGVAGLLHTQLDVQNIIMSIDIPNREFNGAPHVHFNEVLHALGGRVAGVQLPKEDAERMQLCFADLMPVHDGRFPKHSAAHYHAALHVQAAVRGFLARHEGSCNDDNAHRPESE